MNTQIEEPGHRLGAIPLPVLTPLEEVQALRAMVAALLKERAAVRAQADQETARLCAEFPQFVGLRL